MSQLGRFIGFEAAVALLHDRGEVALLDEVEERCRAQADRAPEHMRNEVRAIYEQFSLEELSDRISQLVRPRTPDWTGEVSIIYQSVEGLRSAIPNHSGDWYFTGDYPTPGGYRVLNTSYLNWRAACDVRAY
jgi:amidophosphoribosyltransferase